MIHVFKKDIDNVINSCNKAIIESIRHINGNTGWHHHLHSHKIGIVASAMGLIYCKKFGIECNEKVNIINFLKNMQKEDGGWPYISNSNGQSNVDSTCWALLALYEYDLQGNDEIINKGFSWIKSQYNNPDEDSGWSLKKGYPSRTYLTAFVLRTIHKLGIKDVELNEATVQWLINSQNGDGGWGILPDKDSNIFSTCYCIQTLVECKIERENPIINNAYKWLIKELNNKSANNSILDCYLEFIEYGEGENKERITYFHYVMPIIIKTLLDAKINNKIILDSINLLLKKSTNGYIEHPMLENSKIYPMWAIYNTVEALQSFRNYFDKYENKHEFIFFMYKIRGFSKYNFIRFLIKYKNIIFSTIIFYLVISFNNLIVLFYCEGYKTLHGQIIIAILGSVIYETFPKLYKFLFSVIKKYI